MTAHHKDQTAPTTKAVRRQPPGARERADEPRSFAPSSTEVQPEGRLGPAGAPAEGKRDEP